MFLREAVLARQKAAARPKARRSSVASVGPGLSRVLVFLFVSNRSPVDTETKEGMILF